jgi:hypothetical protein
LAERLIAVGVPPRPAREEKIWDKQPLKGLTEVTFDGGSSILIELNSKVLNLLHSNIVLCSL